MQRIKRAWKNEKGLTLVELLAVVVILGIIAAIAVPSIGGIIENSKRDAHLANAQQMVNSAELVAISNLSDRVDSTYYVTLGFLVNEGYLDNFEDPFTGNPYTLDGSSQIRTAVPPADSNYVTIVKNGSRYSFSVTLNTAETDFNIVDQPENELDRENAFDY